MRPALKYAVVERERRFLVSAIPDGVVSVHRITDRYVDDTRLRLREVVADDGSVLRKLNQKVRLGTGAREVACTSIYLDAGEWEALQHLPGRELTKTRHIVERDGLRVCIDELADRTLLAEIDDGDRRPAAVPHWLPVLADVTDDEEWTGATLAR